MTIKKRLYGKPNTNLGRIDNQIHLMKLAKIQPVMRAPIHEPRKWNSLYGNMDGCYI